MKLSKRPRLAQSLAEEAVQYAKRGWPIFPCQPYIKGAHGCNGATANEEQVRAWWEQYPDASIGLATGARSGMFVLDVDAHNGGCESLENLERAHGKLLPTLTQVTPHGGRHYFFRYNGENIRNRTVWMGIETKADGGGVTLGPSLHREDKALPPYRWLEGHGPSDIDLAAAPQWLMDLIVKAEPPPRPEEPSTRSWEGCENYLKRAFDRIVTEMSEAAEGTRNNTLNKCAFELGQFRGGNAPGTAEAEERLRKAASTTGLDDDEIERTMTSGLAAGEKEPRQPPLPELVMDNGNLPATARQLRDLLAKSGLLFERGVPVKVARPADGGPPTAVELVVSNVVMVAHDVCRPMKIDDDGLVPVTLPDKLARMYLEMWGEWDLLPLAGVTTAPLLAPDGTIRTANGYDPETRLWCNDIPNLIVPEQPTRDDAESALLLLRKTFRTFPFADSVRHRDAELGVEVVDIGKAPGQDESAFLSGLLTAAVRATLWLAPGFLVTAPTVSGAGSGKGLLVRSICTIAFGVLPRAFTAGHDRQELDKRLAAELVGAAPCLFLDNVNGATLRSDTLAAVMTERPSRVRLLGKTRMVPLNSAAWVAITGNGLGVSEDLARRFILCELDAKLEDPETRPFAPGFRENIEDRRRELLTAVLTIWRWGRHNVATLTRGRPLGSFESWCEWVRDPLLTLGCRDPVERIEDIKANDPARRRVAELFQTWWYTHEDCPMKVAELDGPVRKLADPQDRGRQYLASYLTRLVGTRAAGFVLTRQEAAGRWGAATYQLRQTDPEAADDGERGEGEA